MLMCTSVIIMYVKTDKSNNWISNTLHFLCFHFSKNVFLLSNFVWHYFHSGADVIDTVRFSYCLVTKFVNAETGKTFKHLAVIIFFLSYSTINFSKMFWFLLTFQHICQQVNRHMKFQKEQMYSFVLRIQLLSLK